MSVKEHLRLPSEIGAVVLLCAIAFIHGVFCVRYVTKPVGISQKGEQSGKMIVTEWNKTLSESTQCSLVLKLCFCVCWYLILSWGKKVFQLMQTL